MLNSPTTTGTEPVEMFRSDPPERRRPPSLTISQLCLSVNQLGPQPSAIAQASCSHRLSAFTQALICIRLFASCLFSLALPPFPQCSSNYPGGRERERGPPGMLGRPAPTRVCRHGDSLLHTCSCPCHNIQREIVGNYFFKCKIKIILKKCTFEVKKRLLCKNGEHFLVCPSHVVMLQGN